MKIKKKAKKTGAKWEIPDAPEILPNSGRKVNRPEIDAFCSRIAAIPVVDDLEAEEIIDLKDST